MNTKIRFTADSVLQIVRAIFEDNDVNAKITDVTAPQDWQGKTLSEILNVEYYTFKHRPVSPNDFVKKLLEEKGEADNFAAVKQSYCLFSLDNVERLYTKDVDMAVLEATLQYYTQTDKIKLIEYLVEDSNIATSGLRIPVQFGNEVRKAVVIFGRPKARDFKTSSPHGETARVVVDVAITLYPNVVSYSDYTVKVSFTDSDGNAQNNIAVPLTSFSFVNAMTQDAVPSMNNRQKVGNINLSCATSFVLILEGYDNTFINYITDKALTDGVAKNGGNNQPFILTVERGGKSYTHEVIIKDHKTDVNADTNNETHTLSLVKRGVRNAY